MEFGAFYSLFLTVILNHLPIEGLVLFTDARTLPRNVYLFLDLFAFLFLVSST